MDPSKLLQLSSNALSGCCKMCGEPEKEDKRFLICGHSLCMYRYYHIRCMTPGQIASDEQLGNRCWYCPSCLCRACFCDVDDKELMMCDGCDEGYHLYCLDPPLSSVPKGKWYCASCIEKRAKEREMRKYEKRMLKLHRNDDGALVQCANVYGTNLLLSTAKKLGDGKKAATIKT